MTKSFEPRSRTVVADLGLGAVLYFDCERGQNEIPEGSSNLVEKKNKSSFLKEFIFPLWTRNIF